jgi:hypothetical protein
MKKQSDEENFEAEAELEDYRCWTQTGIPSEVTEVFNDQSVVKPQPSSLLRHSAISILLCTRNQKSTTLHVSTFEYST